MSNKVAMAIACHPDDIEFQMAGTLLQLQKLGWEIHYMNIANGSLGTEKYDYETIVRMRRQEAIITYDIDEYDERLLRHLALGYTKDMITNLKGMPFGIKSLEKRQNELIARLFKPDERNGVNACRLVTRAFELRIIDVDNLEEDEE